MANSILRPEHAGAVLGVPGRFHNIIGEAGAETFKSQTWVSEPRPIEGYGKDAKLRVEVRFDDECRNGHNSFAITAEVRCPGARDIEAGGCLHDDIAAIFPELAPLIAWHLCDVNGPMHYLSNTIYLAGDRDHWGLLKGQPHQFETAVVFGDNPIKHPLKKAFATFLQAAAPHNGRTAFDFEVIAIDHKNRGGNDYKFGPKFTFGGYGSEWHDCPFASEAEALNFLAALQTCSPKFIKVATSWGEGKARDLDGARRVAVWPDASDEILCSDADTLRAALVARLPGLVARMRADIERAGLAWSPATLLTDKTEA
jgi:hypothetical protein